MSSTVTARSGKVTNIFESPTFDKDIRIHVDQPIGSASISPSGRDVVLASQQGLYVIDLDSPYSPPRHLRHQTSWTPADVQWSPFASRYYWVVSTSNQRALVWNLELASLHAPIEHTLHAHSRAITDINFSPLHPDLLATCAVDAFVHCWDLRVPARPVVSFSDWFAGATQVKWSRRDEHIIASSHDKYLHVWDDRKGAIPLKTVEAHQTKIYGIDWSRTHSTQIVTCSLDRTLKLWDYEISETEPERTINTAFPVWRARHTPFGNGVLAMPQRGDNDLHLYDYQSFPEDVPSQIQPNYRFTGHDDHVKEFLWRVRGNVDEHVDCRDFQLVSWGADRELILHRIGEKQFQAVGHQKGMRPERAIQHLRSGAPYKSFKDRHVPTGSAADGATTSNQGPVHPPLGSSPGMNKAPIPIPGDWADSGTMMTYSGIETRNVKQQDNGLITWMKGVKFGKRKPSSPEKQRFRRLSIIADPSSTESNGSRESLSDEIIHVGDKFKKVTVEEADVSNRHVQVSLNGPWALDGELVFIQLSLDFPPDYPESSAPWLHIEKASALSEERIAEIESDLRKITAGYLIHRRGCIEGLLSYLLGERNLQESIGWLGMNNHDTMGSEDQAESSSDEEDGLLGEFAGGESQTLGMENSMGSGIFSSNANVPLPRTCGALWAPNGQLICFMPPKQEPRSILQHFAVEDRERGRGSKEIFEGFGRLHTTQTDLKIKSRSDDMFEDEESDDSSEFSSSTSSSSGSDPPEILLRKFQPPSAWHGGSLRFPRFRTHSADGSMPTSNGVSKKVPSVRHKTLVRVLDMEALVPSKRALANDYMIYGDGAEVCSHNAQVAQQNGFVELAEIWEFIGLILAQKVPLSLLSLPSSDEDVYVLACRALVQMRRSDSGLDLSFDEPEDVIDPQEEALIRWGNHPLASTWLIKALFEFFERSHDIQMLAMMSCVFGQSIAADGQHPLYEKLPGSLIYAAQSKEYFPNKEAAIGFFEPIISISSASSRRQRKIGSTGSAWSPQDPGEQELLASEPVTPFSTGTTPPMLLSRGVVHRSSMPPSLAASPEQHRTSIPSATSSFATSVIARPFALASSPPVRNRLSGEELSSSVPSNSAVNWNRNSRNFKRSDSTVRRSFVSQGLTDYDDDGSTEEDDEPFTPQTRVKISLQNQGMFDDEGCANLTFLDSSRSMKFAYYRRVYASMLGAWGLQIQQNEVSKFNGLVAMASSSNKPRNRSSQSTLRLSEGEDDYDVLDSLGPQVVRCCMSCGDVDRVERRSGVNNRCVSCGGRSQILPCTICHQPIAGLHKVCLACGHAAHVVCLTDLIDSLSEDERPECEAGCDCFCTEKISISSEEAFGFANATSPRPKEVGFHMLPIEKSTIFTRRGSIEAKQARARERTRNEPFRITNNGLRRTRTRSVGH